MTKTVNLAILKACFIMILLLGCSLPVSAGGDLKENPVRFAIIGDRTGGHTEGVYGECLAEISRLRPEFIFTVGDAIEGYSEDSGQVRKEWQEYKKLIEAIECPIYHTPANHDISFDSMEPLYEEFIGDPVYSFNHRDVHFSILDNSRFDSPEQWPAEQLEWLKKDLKKHRKAEYRIVFFHKPFWFNTLGSGKPDPLHEIFKEYKVDAVFTGHFHRYFSGIYDGIKYASIGSSGGGSQPDPTGVQYHYAWVTVDEQGVQVAPIKKESVLEWDHMTVDDWHKVNDIWADAVRVNNSMLIDDSFTLIDSLVAIEVYNPNKDHDLKKTLAWKIPEGWRIEPSEIEVNLKPETKSVFQFSVRHEGAVKELPVSKIEIPYEEGKKLEVQKQFFLTRKAAARLIDQPPVIDGFAREDGWGEPVKTFFDSRGGAAKTDPVEIYFAHDAQNLYIAAKCFESEMDKIAAASADRDGAVYRDDCIGFFFQPDRDFRKVYQIYFNPIGAVFDQSITFKEDGQFETNIDWNGNYTVKAGRNSDYWRIEVQIPKSELDLTGQSAKEWGVNFRRKQPRLGAADWLTPISYDPDTFGTLVFE